MNEVTNTQIEVRSKFISMAVVFSSIKKNVYFFVKRMFDISASIIALILLSWLFLIISFLIRKEDKGSAIYTQKRIGKNGKEFNFYKFRSMRMDADEILKDMLKNDKELAKEYKKNKKLVNDPRVTKIGAFIRKTSIDELPQLINVIKGDMTLIGNRPYLPREKKDMGKYYNVIVSTKPGITGYWQVSGRSNTTFKERLKLEKYYSENYGFKLDTMIFLKTFKVVLCHKGAE